jgi:hypothetical protein
MNRRTFLGRGLKAAAGLAALVALPQAAAGQDAAEADAPQGDGCRWQGFALGNSNWVLWRNNEEKPCRKTGELYPFITSGGIPYPFPADMEPMEGCTAVSIPDDEALWLRSLIDNDAMIDSGGTWFRLGDGCWRPFRAVTAVEPSFPHWTGRA